MGAKCYVDKYVNCPFYTREESKVTRKIHCEGFKEGTHIHLCFDSTDTKKVHKKKYCKSDNGYTRCPLYQIIEKQYTMEGR